MKVVLAGDLGNLGADILKCLVADGNEIVAAGGASVADSVITGTMNYFVEGVIDVVATDEK